MLPNALLLVISVLFAAITALAAPAPDSAVHVARAANWFDVHDLSVIQPLGNSSQRDVSVALIIQDNNPIANGSTQCNVTWTNVNGNYTSGNYPTGGYVPCLSQGFAFNFADDGFTNASSFTLQFEHAYRDDSMGPPPWNERTTFAQATVVPSQMECLDIWYDRQLCHLAAGVQLQAPVTETMSRKRRTK